MRTSLIGSVDLRIVLQFRLLGAAKRRYFIVGYNCYAALTKQDLCAVFPLKISLTAVSADMVGAMRNLMYYSASAPTVILTALQPG